MVRDLSPSVLEALRKVRVYSLDDPDPLVGAECEYYRRIAEMQLQPRLEGARKAQIIMGEDLSRVVY